MTLLDKLERRIGFIAIPGTDPDRRHLHRPGLRASSCSSIPAQLISRASILILAEYGARPRGRSLAAWSPTSSFRRRSSSSCLVGDGSLVSLVHWRRPRAGLGTFPAHALFHRRNDRHHGRGVLLRQQPVLQRDAVHASLFFAFAHFYPEEVIYVFFILPMKIKWLAWIYAGIPPAWASSPESNVLSAGADRGFQQLLHLFRPGDVSSSCGIARKCPRGANASKCNRAVRREPLHRCATCGATELSDPNLEFRVSRDGEEYCVPHLPSAGVPRPSR